MSLAHGVAWFVPMAFGVLFTMSDCSVLTGAEFSCTPQREREREGEREREREDFHILHSAYVYICCSILKVKTYNWLPNTHTTATTTNKKQLGTSHRLLIVNSLAQTHLSCAKFRPIWVIKTIFKKSHHFLKTKNKPKDVLLSNVHVQQRPIHYTHKKNGIAALKHSDTGKRRYPGICSSDPSWLPRRQ